MSNLLSQINESVKVLNKELDARNARIKELEAELSSYRRKKEVTACTQYELDLEVETNKESE